MQESLRSRRGLWLTLAMAFLIHGVASFWAEVTPRIRETNDSFEYLRTARNLYEFGVNYSGDYRKQIDPAKYTRRPPGYPLILAAIRTVSSGLFWVALAQVLMTFAVAFMLWQVLRFLNVEYRYQLAVLAFYLFYPPQVIYSQLVMAEVTFQLVIFAALFFLVRFLGNRHWRDLLLFDLMFAVAPLVKPMALYFWIPNAGYHLWLAWRLGSKRILLFSLVPVAAVSLWSYRNLIMTGYFHFSSIKTAAMRHLTRDEAKPIWNSASFAERSRALEGAYFKEKLSHWPRTMRSHAIGAIGFYLDPGRFDLYQFLGIDHEGGLSRIASGREGLLDGLKRYPPFVLLYLSLMFLLNLCIASAFCGFALRPFKPFELKVFVLTVVLYFTIIIGPMGYSRYRLGIEPFILLGAILWLGRDKRDQETLFRHGSSSFDKKSHVGWVAFSRFPKVARRLLFYLR